MERCLAGEAVVNKGNRAYIPLRSTLYTVIRTCSHTTAQATSSLAQRSVLFTTVPQARQPSTGSPLA